MQMSSPAAQATPTGAATQPMSSVPTSTTGTLGQMGTVTTVNFVLIAVFALLVVIAIIYGVRQKAKRRAAEREERARVESFGGAMPLREAGAAFTGVAQDKPRPTVMPRPTPASGDTDLSGSGVTGTPMKVPRHDPIPLREERGTVVDAGPAVPLTRIKGLGPKVATRLSELGVTRVDQIAALSDDEADALDAQLGAFRGRIARDRWVEQARFLAAGDVRGFEAVFGRL